MAQFDHCVKAEIPAEKRRPAILCKVDSASSSGLLLTLPRKLPWGFKRACNAPLTVVFFDPLQGLTRCSCRLSDPVRQGDRRVYRCEVLEMLSQQERRRELKVTVSVAVEVEFDGRLWPCTTGNISAGGVMLLSSEMIAHKGDVLRFQFNEAGESIPLAAEVLRVELRPSEGGKVVYSYGCRFMDLDPKYVALLRDYVVQREQGLYFSNK